MLPDGFLDSPLLLLLVAAAPGVVNYVTGRRVQAAAHDALLAEQLAARDRRGGFVLLLSLAALTALDAKALVWTLPLVMAGAYAGNYALRKAVFGETWTLPVSMGFFGRSTVGLFGFWIALGATPPLVAAAGDRAWIAAVAMAFLLLSWNARYADVVRWCLRTRPLEEGPILDASRALAARCRVAPPRFDRIDLRGGVIANAMALPSPRTSSVLFTDTLLTRLREDEVAAICAHELAHLEYYDRARMRRLSAVSIAAIACATLWTPLVQLAPYQPGGWAMVVWLGVLLGILGWRAHGRQEQETACDLRAVALMGSADPVERALTALHAISRIPRRVELQQDQAASHPSLARRLKAIRAAGGTAVAASAADADRFASPDGTTSVVFDDRALRWTGPDAVTHAIEYGQLTELRLDIRRASSARLVVRSRHGQAWDLALSTTDAAAVQRALDRVDVHLGEPVPVAILPRRLTRPAVAFVAAAALVLGHFAVAAAALLACVRTATPLLMAAAVAALVAAGATLSYLDGQTVATALALMGGILLLVAWTSRREPHGAIALPIVLLAACAALPVAAVFLSGTDAVRLHQALRTTPSVLTLLAALATACACVPRRGARLAGLACAIAGLGAAAAASPGFLDRFGSDPFLVQGPALRLVTLSDDPIDEFAIPFPTTRLRLSPDGSHVAVMGFQADTGLPAFKVGPASGELRPVAGDDLIFLDDGHVLTSDGDSAGTILRKVRLNEAREVVWQQRVEQVVTGQLSYARHEDAWRLTGPGPDGSLVRAAGSAAGSDLQIATWPSSTADETWPAAFTSSGADALVAETRFDTLDLAGGIPAPWHTVLMMLHGLPQETRYSLVRGEHRVALGRSRLRSTCYDGVLGDGVLACVAYDGSRTRFVRLDVSGGVTGLGWLQGEFTVSDSAAGGWLTGWSGHDAAAVHLDSGRAYRLPRETCPAIHLTAAGGRLLAATFDGDTTRVRRYALPAAPHMASKARP